MKYYIKRIFRINSASKVSSQRAARN